MIGYIFIGIMAIVLIYIVVLYFKNSKKINATKKPEKNDEKSSNAKSGTTTDKVEVKSQISSHPLHEEMSELEFRSRLKEEFGEAKNHIRTEDNSNRLKYEKPAFKSELQAYKEYQNSIKATAGYEGPSQEQIAKVNREIESKKVENQNKKVQSIKDEMAHLSPELITILVNDILNKKY